MITTRYTLLVTFFTGEGLVFGEAGREEAMARCQQMAALGFGIFEEDGSYTYYPPAMIAKIKAIPSAIWYSKHTGKD